MHFDIGFTVCTFVEVFFKSDINSLRQSGVTSTRQHLMNII